MLIAGVIALCVVILILAFLFPKLSHHPQRGSQKGFGMGGRGASKHAGREAPAPPPAPLPSRQPEGADAVEFRQIRNAIFGTPDLGRDQ